MTRETRTIQRGPKIETRADGKRVLSGYAAVFYRASDPGTQYRLWDHCMERISPTAFNRAIEEKQDVIADFNHDEGRMLGRTGSGTLRLSVDETGLKYEVDLPQMTDPPNLAELIERGDITGSSFAFQATGVNWETDGDIEIRTVTDVNLFDVGPVGRPAYAATSIGIRGDDKDLVAKEFEAHKRNAQAIEIRLRMLELDT